MRYRRLQRLILCLIGLEIATAAVNGESVAPARAVGEAGPARLVLDAPERLVGLSWSQYLETVKQYASMKALVPLSEPISNEADDVAYGLNAVQPIADAEKIANLSWAIIARQKGAPVLIVDTNANGRLGDDPRLKFTEERAGRFAANQVVRVSDHGTVTELPILWIAERRGDEMQLVRYTWRERTGSVEIEGERYSFALRTRLAGFDAAGSVVGIDTNRDGKVNFEGYDDTEVFALEEETVAIAGREYRMSVAHDGAVLTLTSTGRGASTKLSLAVGVKAPTLEGGSPLIGAQGRPVLISFWSPHCGVSKRVAPQLRETWEELKGARFVSVADVPAKDIAEFVESNRQEWPQIAGEEGKGLFGLYQVTVLPTFYVVDGEGVIRERGSTLDWLRVRDMLGHLSSPGTSALGVAPGAGVERERE